MELFLKDEIKQEKITKNYGVFHPEYSFAYFFTCFTSEKRLTNQIVRFESYGNEAIKSQ